VWQLYGGGRHGGCGVVCPYCGKIYHQKGLFLRHYSTHTGEKPFACPYCPHRTILKGDMNRHISIHKGEKPFACTNCSYRSVKKSDLKRHVAALHKNSQFQNTENI